jgi:hypothetical protein
VFGGLNRLFATAVVAGAVLLVPPAALADGCGGVPSAQNVYTECLQNGGGGKPTSSGHKSSGHKSSGHKSGGSSTQSSTAVPVPKQTAKALKKAGNDGKSLYRLVRGYGSERLLQASNSPTSAPTAIGSAFDLGSGPTVLLIGLAGTAILLLAATGFRFTRQRR